VTSLNVYELTAATDRPSTVTLDIEYPEFGVIEKVWFAP
jgi:hypothetical protein